MRRARSLGEHLQEARCGLDGNPSRCLAVRNFERALPIRHARQRRAARDRIQPTVQEFVRREALPPGYGEQPANALLTQTMHQDVGQGRAALPVVRGECRNSMGKVEPEAGAFRAREKVIVPRRRIRRRDRDLIGFGDAGCDELPRPSQALDHLVADVGARNDGGLFHWGRIQPHDCAAEPAGVGFGRRDPLDRDYFAKRLDQGAPDRRDKGQSLDAYLAEDPRRMPNAFQRGVAQVPGNHRSWRQARFQAGLDQRHLHDAVVTVTGWRREIEVRGPGLPQGSEHRPRHARQMPHALEFVEAAFVERLLDYGLQLIG